MTFHLIRSLALLALAALVVLAGCRSTDRVGDQQATAFDPAFTPPAPLETDAWRLEVLTPELARVDYDAFMSSREHLRRTLHWGTWPRDETTLEENRRDLERHATEFDSREAYAYSVLRPDGSAAIGCVYINPVEGDPSAADVAYWTTEAGMRANLDRHLFEAVMQWLVEDWPFETVRVPIHPENTRGIRIAEAAGLTRADTEEGRIVFVKRG